MAQIVINEISQNYTYNIGTNSYATVAMPITSCWGPGFFDAEAFQMNEADMLDSTSWQRFPATQRGLEAFVSTYRGPCTGYRLAQDYSYQMAMTLLTAGYDVLVCRLCPGSPAEIDLNNSQLPDELNLVFKAKYPGSFGNKLRLDISKKTYRTRTPDLSDVIVVDYWNVVVSIVDASGVKTNLENLSFVTDFNDATEAIPYYQEVESQFISMYKPTTSDNPHPHTNNVTPLGLNSANRAASTSYYAVFTGGEDMICEEKAEEVDVKRDGSNSVAGMDYIEARSRYIQEHMGSVPDTYLQEYASCYQAAMSALSSSGDSAMQQILATREWIFAKLITTAASDELGFEGVYDLLKDKLAYNHNRVISSGWDDQDMKYLHQFIDGEDLLLEDMDISPLHFKLMDVAYFSRCATAYIDIPRTLARRGVYSEDETSEGYAQKLARFIPATDIFDINGTLYHTHSALFAPWGRYTYIGTNKQNIACPSFLALMIQRAQILNQAAQYEWALPTNRKHNLRLGKLDYNVPKKLLDKWQTLEGVGVNVITAIPDLGINIWGNSTLFELPPATYQALANLSTRLLVNAVEDVAYRVGISITFQYNNEQAYNKFYAGVTPILDTMKNIGAIDDYYVKMAADINGLDQVNANTVVGKIYLVVNGVINDIFIDLIALPPGTDLNLYRS